MAGFRKGQTRPEKSGRKKGTPNRNSLRVLDELDRAGVNLVKEYLKAVSLVEDHEKRIAYMLRLFRYCFPRLKEIDPPPHLLPPPAPAGATSTTTPEALLSTLLSQAQKDAIG